MEAVKRKLSELVPYDKNPRKNKEAVKHVLESLKRHGQKKPIVLSAKGAPFEKEVICAGHTTMEALKEFGAKEAFCVLHEFKDEAEFVDYNIRDNKTGEFALWDEVQLQDLSISMDLDLNEMGFDLGDEWDSDIEDVEKIEKNLDGIKAKIVIEVDPDDKDDAEKVIWDALKNAGIKA